MDGSLFRKTALAKLASPEQLDYMVTVTSPRGWMALFALAALLAAGILWGLYGSVPTMVTGNGILLIRGGIHSATSETSGQVMEVHATVGQTVQQGQVIARVERHDFVEMIKKTEAELKELKADYRRLVDLDQAEIKMRKTDTGRQREGLRQQINNNRQYLDILKEKLVDREKLLAEGLVTRQSVLKARQEINEIEQAIASNINRLQALDTEVFVIAADKERRQLKEKEHVAQQEEELTLLRDRLNVASKVISPYAGRVLEVLIEKGELVKAGDTLITMEGKDESDKNLEGLIFASPLDGKRVRPGMHAHISPSTVKEEEYGFLKGRVTYVSELPASKKELMHILKNDELVAQFMQQGSPIEIRMDLMPDSGTVSGLAWSSPKGPPVRIHSGTLCFSKVIVDEQPPIALIVPLLKRTFLGAGER